MLTEVYEVHVQIAKLIFRSLLTKKSLMELRIREGTEVFLSFSPDSVQTL
jgi:molybdopterin-binding protein